MEMVIDHARDPLGNALNLHQILDRGAADGLGLSVGLSERNFLGRGQFVSVDLNLGAKFSTSTISFAEPRFLGRDLRFGFDASYAQTQSSFAKYDTRIIEIRPSIEFPVSQMGRLELSYTARQSKLFNVSATDTSPIVQRDAATGGQLASAIGYRYSWDSRRNGFNDPNAFVLRFGQEFGGIGGDLKYIETTASTIAEFKFLNEELVLRSEVDIGARAPLSGGTTRVTERFFLDGKMRGFDPFGVGPRDTRAAYANRDALGGNMFAVARLEAQFPIGFPAEYGILGGAFIDVGSVWGLGRIPEAQTGVVDDKMRARVVAGLSLFWDTPVGPLRFNFTRALKKQPYDKERRFDLTISTRF